MIPPQMRSTRSFCAACGEVIGVYEPAVLLPSSGNVIRASGLTLSDVDEGTPMHESCYQRAGCSPDPERS